LTNSGEPLVGYLTLLVGTYVEASGVQKQGACHMFRHTMATLMLENGAEIRFIQAMLGHTDLKSTDIYTHVAIRKLQEIHRANPDFAKDVEDGIRERSQPFNPPSWD
jgi:integrase/recombinase XerD